MSHHDLMIEVTIFHDRCGEFEVTISGKDQKINLPILFLMTIRKEEVTSPLTHISLLLTRYIYIILMVSYLKEQRGHVPCYDPQKPQNDYDFP